MSKTSALVSNNASATLAAGIISTDTSLTVNTGQGALFPNPGTNEYFYTTLTDGGANIEIVKCTARSGDTFTIVRAQDGTTAQAFSTGDIVELRPIAELFREKADFAIWSVSKAVTDKDYVLAAGYNGLSLGPILIDSGFTVTIENTATWHILNH